MLNHSLHHMKDTLTYGSTEGSLTLKLAWESQAMLFLSLVQTFAVRLFGGEFSSCKSILQEGIPASSSSLVLVEIAENGDAVDPLIASIPLSPIEVDMESETMETQRSFLPPSTEKPVASSPLNPSEREDVTSPHEERERMESTVSQEGVRNSGKAFLQVANVGEALSSCLLYGTTRIHRLAIRTIGLIFPVLEWSHSMDLFGEALIANTSYASPLGRPSSLVALPPPAARERSHLIAGLLHTIGHSLCAFHPEGLKDVVSTPPISPPEDAVWLEKQDIWIREEAGGLHQLAAHYDTQEADLLPSHRMEDSSFAFHFSHYNTAAIRTSLAAEYVDFVRKLISYPEWCDSVRQHIEAVLHNTTWLLEETPAEILCTLRSTALPSPSSLHPRLASICECLGGLAVLGGVCETLRVGGLVEHCSTTGGETQKGMLVRYSRYESKAGLILINTGKHGSWNLRVLPVNPAALTPRSRVDLLLPPLLNPHFSSFLPSSPPNGLLEAIVTLAVSASHSKEGKAPSQASLKGIETKTSPLWITETHFQVPVVRLIRILSFQIRTTVLSAVCRLLKEPAVIGLQPVPSRSSTGLQDLHLSVHTMRRHVRDRLQNITSAEERCIRKETQTQALKFSPFRSLPIQLPRVWEVITAKNFIFGNDNWNIVMRVVVDADVPVNNGRGATSSQEISPMPQPMPSSPSSLPCVVTHDLSLETAIHQSNAPEPIDRRDSPSPPPLSPSPSPDISSPLTTTRMAPVISSPRIDPPEEGVEASAVAASSLELRSPFLQGAANFNGLQPAFSDIDMMELLDEDDYMLALALEADSHMWERFGGDPADSTQADASLLIHEEATTQELRLENATAAESPSPAPLPSQDAVEADLLPTDVPMVAEASLTEERHGPLGETPFLPLEPSSLEAIGDTPVLPSSGATHATLPLDTGGSLVTQGHSSPPEVESAPSVETAMPLLGNAQSSSLFSSPTDTAHALERNSMEFILPQEGPTTTESPSIHVPAEKAISPAASIPFFTAEDAVANSPHAEAMRFTFHSSSSLPCITGMGPTFTEGDIIGVGWILKRGHVFFTKNGHCIKIHDSMENDNLMVGNSTMEITNGSTERTFSVDQPSKAFENVKGRFRPTVWAFGEGNSRLKANFGQTAYCFNFEMSVDQEDLLLLFNQRGEPTDGFGVMEPSHSQEFTTIVSEAEIRRHTMAEDLYEIMGGGLFPVSLCVLALERTRDSLELAMEWLLSHGFTELERMQTNFLRQEEEDRQIQEAMDGSMLLQRDLEMQPSSSSNIVPLSSEAPRQSSRSSSVVAVMEDIPLLSLPDREVASHFPFASFNSYCQRSECVRSHFRRQQQDLQARNLQEGSDVGGQREVDTRGNISSSLLSFMDTEATDFLLQEIPLGIDIAGEGNGRGGHFQGGDMQEGGSRGNSTLPSNAPLGTEGGGVSGRTDERLRRPSAFPEDIVIGGLLQIHPRVVDILCETYFMDQRLSHSFHLCAGLPPLPSTPLSFPSRLEDSLRSLILYPAGDALLLQRFAGRCGFVWEIFALADVQCVVLELWDEELSLRRLLCVPLHVCLKPELRWVGFPEMLPHVKKSTEEKNFWALLDVLEENECAVAGLQ
ncbi:UBA/TS-N domain-containing protein, partial [Cardiosporidium cionae]